MNASINKPGYEGKNIEEMSIQKNDNNKLLKEYEIGISLMQYHTELLWQQFGAFILVQAILIGFIGTGLVDVVKSSTTKEGVLGAFLLFSGSIIGFVLCILWAATYFHNYGYYRLRILQAKRAEEQLGFLLLSEGKDLSEGKIVPIGKDEIKLSFLAFLLPPRRSIPILIALFAIIFLILAMFVCPILLVLSLCC